MLLASMNWWHVLLVVGLVQGCFLMLSLSTSREDQKRTNRYLILLLFAVSVQLAFELSVVFDVAFVQTVFRIVSIAAALVIGPSLLFYILQLTSLEKNSPSKVRWHYAPFVFVVILLIILELSAQAITQVPSTGIPWYVSSIELLKFVHLNGYLLVSLIVFKRFRAKKELQFQDNAKVVFGWLWGLIVFFFSVLSLSAIYFVSFKYFGLVVSIGNPETIVGLLILVIYLMAFMAIRHPLVLSMEAEKLLLKRAPKYKTSALNSEERSRIGLKIEQLMNSERPFLNEQLKVQDLADQLNVPSHHLSQTINQEFGKSFQDYVNHFRVEEFKKKLMDQNESHKTILALAFESGFSSKASFNRIFKSVTSLTPGEFKKQNS